jgi:hypothetical protein
MNQSKIELSEKIVDKLLESNAGDIGQYPELIKPLLYKVYTESLVSEIADVQQLNSPVGKIYSLFSNYGGRTDDDLNAENSTVLVVSDGTSFVVNGAVTSSTCVATLVYKEGNNLLVKITSGYFVIAQTLNGGSVTVSDVISNRNYVRKVFQNYSGPFATAVGELVTPNEIDHEIKSGTINVKSRKIKSKISQEVITDIKSMYGEDIADDILTNEFASEMIQSIDMEVITYLKTIATPITDVILSNSYGTQNDISAIANDLYSNIYKITTDIMRNTKRRKNFFVLADAATMGLMMTSPLNVKPEGDTRNSYFMGKIGGSYNLYLDPYSTDHYVLVGYNNSKASEIGDSGLIFAPYVNTIWSTSEPETGKQIFFNLVRYGYTTNPQDTTTGVSDSIFFKMFKVDLTNLKNYTNIA